MKLPKHLRRPRGEIGAKLVVWDASQRLVDEIDEAFTFKNPLYAQAARFSPWGPPKTIPEYIRLAEVNNGMLAFPRGIMPYAQLSDAAYKEFQRIKWRDATTNAPTTFPPLKVTLNAAQTTLRDAFKQARIKRTHPYRAFLFIAPTSVGKTIAQAVVAASTGQRTLILSLTNWIKKAWLEDLKMAYGYSNDEIGLIQQKTWRIGENFTIASVQTLAKRKARWQELFDQIGCIIVDEADTISAPSIYNFIFSFPARYVIGATATSGGSRNAYLQAAFGHVVKRLVSTQSDTESSMALREVEEVHTAFKFEYQQGNLDFHALTEAMLTDEERNRMICHQVKKDWLAGHSPLVVTSRVPHVHLLMEILKEMGVKNAHALTGETNTGKKYSAKLREDIFSRKCRCVVATRQAVMRGANLNPLDVLHLTMPTNKHDLEQTIGRIRRKHPGKKTCRVVYYLDKRTPYLFNVFKREAISCFRKLRVPRYENVFVA